MDEVERIVRAHDPGLESGPDVADDLIRDIRVHTRRVAEAVRAAAKKTIYASGAYRCVAECCGSAEHLARRHIEQSVQELDLNAIIKGVDGDA